MKAMRWLASLAIRAADSSMRHAKRRSLRHKCVNSQFGLTSAEVLELRQVMTGPMSTMIVPGPQIASAGTTWLSGGRVGFTSDSSGFRHELNIRANGGRIDLSSDAALGSNYTLQNGVIVRGDHTSQVFLTNGGASELNAVLATLSWTPNPGFRGHTAIDFQWTVFPDTNTPVDGTPVGGATLPMKVFPSPKTILIAPGADGSIVSGFINANGTAYFVATDTIHGGELWKTDGTQAGTVLVKDLNTLLDDENRPLGSNPNYLTNLNGTLYFVADDGVHGNALFKTDGTEAGTVLVKATDYDGIMGPSRIDFVTNLNGTLFFLDSSAHTLWKSDGTDAGTVIVKCFATTDGEWPRMAHINGELIIGVSGGVWTSDGTDSGTTLVNTTLSFTSYVTLKRNGVLYTLQGNPARAGFADVDLLLITGPNSEPIVVKENIFKSNGIDNSMFHSVGLGEQTRSPITGEVQFDITVWGFRHPVYNAL